MAQIKFKKVIYKNFMSVGSAPIEFDLDGSSSNLIIGHNGHGKSSALDAICFGLFGKPHRDVNKNQLINSVNGKQCLVEIYFSIGTIEYKVRRGMRPNIFEIYQDGNLINKTADVRDYQKVLEQQIIKLNYKTFTQVVILGSASFTPFMQLTTHGRREVIEDILDIGIFSIMNQLNKEKSSQTKDELTSVETDIKMTISKIESQNRIINNLLENHQTQIQVINDKLSIAETDLKELEDKLSAALDEVEELSNSIEDSKDRVPKFIDSHHKHIHQREANIENLEQTLEFLKNNDSCHLCRQEISESHKKTVGEGINENINKTRREIDKLDVSLNEFLEDKKKIDSVLKEIQTKNINISSIRASIKSTKKLIEDYKVELTKHSGNTGNIDNEKATKKELAKRGSELSSRKKVLNEQKNLENICSILLKDNGIKTSIIREYLPVMNATINKYLDKMDFFVKFELDENFNETIKSRYRDEFTYASFSEGEKQKIDVSLLLAWRHIAKLKNSVNTNILFLDEVLSTHIDAGSVELLLGILDEMKKETNIFAISHTSDQFLDRFDRIIKFEKVGNFSTMKVF